MDLGDGIKRRAVVYALDKVNPAAYGGWNGDCPGTLKDAAKAARVLSARGYEVVTLIDSAATIGGVIYACEKATADMKAGDKFVIYGSSHGGQKKDLNGDEKGGMDSTICLWDGELVDDRVWEFLILLPAGLEADFITDSCNSGTNYRGPRRFASALFARDMRHARSNGDQIRCSCTHFGGCPDGMSSYGGVDGGVFTNALFAAGPLGYTRREWFAAAKALQPRNQQFVYEEIGPSVGNGKALA